MGGLCGKEQRGSAGIWAASDGGSEYVPLCHPDEGQDCYHLATVYHRPLLDGRIWAEGRLR